MKQPASFNWKLLVFTFVTTLLLPQFSNAQSNYIDAITGQTATGNNEVGEGDSASDNFNINVAFTTGGNADGYIFNSVSLLFARFTGSQMGAFLYVTIQPTQTGDQSSTAMGGSSLNGNFAPPFAGTYTYTPNSGDGFTLSANTTYYLLVAGSAPSGDFQWNYANNLTGSPTIDGWSIGDTFAPGITDPNPIHDTPLFSINATPVVATPEPGTLALAGLGAIACAAMRRKFFRSEL